MCDYCEKGKNLRDPFYERYRIKDSGYAVINGKTLHIEAETACGEDNVGIENDYKINYCPMCGTRLKQSNLSGAIEEDSQASEKIRQNYVPLTSPSFDLTDQQILKKAPSGMTPEKYLEKMHEGYEQTV